MKPTFCQSIQNLDFAVVPGSTNILASWENYETTANNVVYAVYVDGSQVATTNTKSVVLTATGSSFTFDVLPVSSLESATMSLTESLFIKTVGNAFSIVAANPSSNLADFLGYRLYDGSSLVKQLDGIDNNTFFLSFSEGEHTLSLTYVDRLGNESSAGTSYEVSVNTKPEPVAYSEVSFANGVATISWSVSGQDDATGIRVLWNYLNDDPSQDLDDVNLVDVLAEFPYESGSFTSPRLMNGTYEFAVATVDSGGLMSDYNLFPLTVEYINGVLVQISDPPQAVVLNDAIPVAGGLVQYAFDNPNTTNLQFDMYLSGTKVGTEYLTNDLPAKITSITPVVDGEYTAFVQAINPVTLARANSNSIIVSTDATPPSGTQLLTISRV